MTPRKGLLALAALLAVLAAYVWHSAQQLPLVVASHFGSGGAADGFMPRGMYIGFMLAIIVGVPLLLAVLPTLAAGSDGARLKIPDRDHWLAPERRRATLAFVALHGQCFAAVVAVFLAYVQGLVVRANQLTPPMLQQQRLVAALVVFFAILGVWLLVLYRRFRRPA